MNEKDERKKNCNLQIHCISIHHEREKKKKKKNILSNFTTFSDDTEKTRVFRRIF